MNQTTSRKKIDLLFVVLICTTFLFLGKRVDRTNWTKFESLTYYLKYDKVMDDVLLVPNWNSDLQKLEGQVVQLTGYFEQKNGQLYFSRKEKTPENKQQKGRQVIQVKQQELDLKVHFDKKCMIEGVLQLNQSDANQLPFTIKDARCLRCVIS